MSSLAFARATKTADPAATPVNAGLLRRRCACGKHTIAGGACADCSEKGKGVVRREAIDRNGPGIAPPIVHQALRSPGRPLDLPTRALMEPRLGRDLSHVRVHTGAEASQSAAAVNASAYAVGSDIVFAEGRYAPMTDTGSRLIAHELAHTVQQNGAPSRPEDLAIGAADDPAEREAEQATDTVVRGGAAASQPGAAQTLRRETPPGAGGDSPASDALTESASPFLAAAIGSVTLDKFETGKSDLTPTHQAELTKTAHNIVVLLRKYGQSMLTVTGFADTVGTEANNLTLGTARALAVKKALVDLKVPDAIISTDSKGEGAPQAAKTKDATANPDNRRVEVRFRPGAAPTIGPPSAGPAATAPTAPTASKPPINLRIPGPILPTGPTLPPDFWKPLPPPIPGTGPKSMSDVIFKIADPVIDRVVKILPESLRAKAKDAIHDGIISGSAKAARAAAEAAGITDSAALDAIENAAKAAIQQKAGGGTQ